MPSSPTFRQRLAAIFDDEGPQHRLAQVFNALLAILIVVNVGAVILESVESLRAKYAADFMLIEHVATAIFAAEYVLRVWTAVDLRGDRFRQPFWGRLHYMRGFFPIIDLIAILPAILGFLGAGDLRVLRLLRLLRMLKLTRHSTVFSLLWAVLREEAQAIAALVFVVCLTLTISGALMYMIEGSEQPAVFSSIPAGMWWAIETITTVGYGDIVPVTLAGRILGGIISIIGIGTLALFSGLITVGFLNQLRLRREERHRAKMQTGASSHHHAPIETAGSLHAADGVASPAICPHCGSKLIAHPANGGDLSHPQHALNP